jgi:hypothetical protein
MVIDVGVMKDLSGLAKAIKPTRLLAGRANIRVEDIIKLWCFKSPGVRSGFGMYSEFARRRKVRSVILKF